MKQTQESQMRFIKHAKQRMKERNVSIFDCEQCIRYGFRVDQTNGRSLYIQNDVVVVTEKQPLFYKIITVWRMLWK